MMAGFSYVGASLAARDRPSFGHQPTDGGAIMKIVVIGGTGLIGSKVVSNLRQKGHEVVAAAPSTGVNERTPEIIAGFIS
jgi:NADPH-dependent 2,4-dienoyl-CoA reductase/sulfur reductase-like enzyme